MSEFFCQQCSDRSVDVESLTLGAIGIHECFVCGRRVNAMNEGYSFFRDGAKARLEAKEEAERRTTQQGMPETQDIKD